MVTGWLEVLIFAISLFKLNLRRPNTSSIHRVTGERPLYCVYGATQEFSGYVGCNLKVLIRNTTLTSVRFSPDLPPHALNPI